MEPFEINLLGERLMVHPQPDGSFQVFRGETKLATLIPNENSYMDNGWTSLDLISSEYVQQIGELIEEHEM